jgi:hypothetical protein
MFNFFEYRNGNQTFILDSHQSFICSVVFDSTLHFSSVKVSFSFSLLESDIYAGEKRGGHDVPHFIV